MKTIDSMSRSGDRPVFVVRSVFICAFGLLLPTGSDLLTKNGLRQVCTTYCSCVCVPFFSFGNYILTSALATETIKLITFYYD
jgi:hypothetical protein